MSNLYAIFIEERYVGKDVIAAICDSEEEAIQIAKSNVAFMPESFEEERTGRQICLTAEGLDIRIYRIEENKIKVSISSW